MKVRPLHDRLVVRRIEEKETAKGGIIIPDTAKEKPQEGEVLAVGNGKILENGTKVALDVKVGDKILFGKYSGHRHQDRRRGGPDPARGRSPRRDRLIDHSRTTLKETVKKWRSRSRTATSPGRRSCAASTAWPTRSR